MQQNRLVKICKLYFVIWGRLGKVMRRIKTWRGKRRVIKKSVTFKTKSCIYEVWLKMGEPEENTQGWDFWAALYESVKYLKYVKYFT